MLIIGLSNYKNKIKHLILISKKSYYSYYFIVNKNNIGLKETWKGIKKIITLKSTKNSRPITLEVGNSKLSNPQAKATAFNNATIFLPFAQILLTLYLYFRLVLRHF